MACADEGNPLQLCCGMKNVVDNIHYKKNEMHQEQ